MRRATRWLAVALAALAACKGPEAPPPEERIVLEPVAFADLDGWQDDDQAAALAAFLESCSWFAGQDPARAIGRDGMAGTAADWQAACQAAALVPPGDGTAARAFFEDRFTPYAASDGADDQGLFTGYYEPLLRGARERTDAFTVPLYGRPPDLVTVDLGRFDEMLAGRTVAGRVEEGALVPYHERKAIVEGALAGRGLEVAWVDSAVDAFFLQIQGSGQVALPDGGRLRLGYAAANGRSYLAIGKVLVERGEIPKDKVSLQTIKAWLLAHPDQADEVMDQNRSYVFFRELTGPGPVGAQGVPLTPGRSLAVDRRFVALGTPVWLDILVPGPDEASPDEAMRRLVVAQDTGGAIKGPVRADLFWGAGAEAESRAGRMKHPGRYVLLLPRGVAVAAAD